MIIKKMEKDIEEYKSIIKELEDIIINIKSKSYSTWAGDRVIEDINCHLNRVRELLKDAESKLRKTKALLKPDFKLNAMIFKSNHGDFTNKDISKAHKAVEKLGSNIYVYTGMNDSTMIFVDKEITQDIADIIYNCIIAFTQDVKDWEHELIWNENVIYAINGENITYVIDETTKNRYRK